MPWIQLRDIKLHFRVPKHGRLGLKEYLVSGCARRQNPYIEVRALQDINIEIAEGERVGIIGNNGAGKSTLLRLIAGVYPPSSGSRMVKGTITSLMDIGLGIEPVASGRDNIAYRCYLQGDTPAQVKAKRDQIAEFSELGEFLDMPVRFYSSGMYVRFAFAVATAIDPEILLIDEVFGAGDAGFQEKARRRMLELVDKARILVFVSHGLGTVEMVCNRVIWMEKGRIVEEGPAKAVIEHYRASQGQAAA